MTIPWQERALSIAEFCEAHSLSQSQAYILISGGLLQAVKSGRRTLILPESHQAYRASLPPLVSRAKPPQPAQPSPAPKRRGRPPKARPASPAAAEG